MFHSVHSSFWNVLLYCGLLAALIGDPPSAELCDYLEPRYSLPGGQCGRYPLVSAKGKSFRPKCLRLFGPGDCESRRRAASEAGLNPRHGMISSLDSHTTNPMTSGRDQKLGIVEYLSVHDAIGFLQILQNLAQESIVR